MPLTEHDRLHVQATINDAVEDMKLVGDKSEKAARAKEVAAKDYAQHLATVKLDAEAILANDELPAGVTRGSELHDFLEKKGGDLSRKVIKKKGAGKKASNKEGPR